MLQQTTVAAAAERYTAFLRRWPTVRDLAAADDSEVMAAWAGLGYYARARNLLKCARQIAQRFGGEFPSDAAELQRLPGIGHYTAAAVSSIAFNRPSAAADGNVERVLARLCAVTRPFPKARTEIRRLAAEFCPDDGAGDWLQALMDLGALVCRPKAPKCEDCPVSAHCEARRLGIEGSLPRKAPRGARVVQRGTLYLGRRIDGAWLLEQRPADGLLGGTLGWPGSGWGGRPCLPPPCAGDWRRVGSVTHTLTHIDLQLDIEAASLPMDSAPDRGSFVPLDQFSADNLPTLMRKAYAAAEAARRRKPD